MDHLRTLEELDAYRLGFRRAVSGRLNRIEGSVVWYWYFIGWVDGKEAAAA